MNLLDAYALIAFLTGGPAAPQVRAILREGNVAVTTTNLIEVLDVSARVRGVPISRTMEILDPLLEGTLSTVPLGLELARRAAEIRARHYHRSDRAISLADAVLVASAGAGDQVVTADADVLAVARALGAGTATLPEQG